jgi:hypothetical protein
MTLTKKVYHSVRDSLENSVWNSAHNFVRVSVWNSVYDSDLVSLDISFRESIEDSCYFKLREYDFEN